MLELVLVLTLAGLLIATAVPNLSKALESFSVARELRQISSQINLFKEIFSLGRPITLNDSEMKLMAGNHHRLLNEFSQKVLQRLMVLKKYGAEMRKLS